MVEYVNVRTGPFNKFRRVALCNNPEHDDDCPCLCVKVADEGACAVQRMREAGGYERKDIDDGVDLDTSEAALGAAYLHDMMSNLNPFVPRRDIFQGDTDVKDAEGEEAYSKSPSKQAVLRQHSLIHAGLEKSAWHDCVSVSNPAHI